MVRLATFAAICLIPGIVATSGELIQSEATEIEAHNNLRARQQATTAFQNWSEGGSNIRCVNGGGGTYTANWNSKGGFVCGKGWNGGVSSR
jgi:endo-1,4-beta-xylanase